VRNYIQHKELDSLLDAMAARPDTFEAEAWAEIVRLDALDRDLEVTEPDAWRRSLEPRSPRGFAQQFRADVETILPLDREEEARLARRIEFARLRLQRARASTEARAPGSDAALRLQRREQELHVLRVEMVERNLYLVLINVERYASSGASRLDLIQEGCVSLFRAADGFDWRRGLLFRTYAVHWLNQAFRNFLYNNSHTVRIPVYIQKVLKHINQATIRLGDPSASPRQIAEHSELNERLVTAALAASRGSYSLESTGGPDADGSRLRDLLVDDPDEDPYSPRLEDVSLEDGLRQALGNIGEREALVLRLRFGVDEEREHTLAEVANRLGVSVERVRQIQVRALTKLNTPTLRRVLSPYVN